MITLKVRDGHAAINHDSTEYEMPSGSLDIIAEDGRTLYSLSLREGGRLEISGHSTCKHEGVILDQYFTIKPGAANRITLVKEVYK